jgi:acetyl esterase/lipase
MRRAAILGLLSCALLLGGAVATRAADDAPYTRTEDVIYGRKWGMALTMDVFAPKKDANGVGIVFVVSGGWHSAHEGINRGFFAELLKRGYTVFAVVHGSEPKFTIPEAVDDMNRAVRYIRYHAKDYHIDPDRIGVTGGSAGGHLSLMLGTAGRLGDAKAKDSVDHVSSRVQAVACLFPPTDFLNYGEKDKIALGRGTLAGFKPPFDFHEQDPKTHAFVPVTDEKKVLEIGKEISPIYHVSAETPPTLIIHGDADALVPIQQSESFIAKLKEAGVPAQLVVHHGAGHGGAGFAATADEDRKTIADWFDKYLGKKTEDK